MRTQFALATFIATAIAAFPFVAQAGTPVTWDGSSGLPPDQSSPAWMLFDDAVPEDPMLSAGVLTLSTDVDDENIYYLQSGSEISIDDPIVVEIRTRVLASTASTPSKAALNVSVTVSPDFGNSLQIGIDEIFVLVDNNVKGPAAAVDTNGAFHTYRIEANLAGDFDVYYDDVLSLSGVSFSSSSANGPVPRVLWGLGSSFSTGTAEIESLSHNAGPPFVPGVGIFGAAFLVATLIMIGANRPKA